MSGSVVVLPMWPTEVSYASPVFTQTTSGTAPSSRRYRRSKRSSEDKEVHSVEGFEEEDLRAGGPNLCEPPCYSIHLTPNHKLHNALYVQQNHHRKIESLATNDLIVVSDISFVGRKSCCNPADDAPPVLTALLTVHRQNPTHRGWAGFARKVWNYLKTCDLGDVSVEIVDQRFNINPYIFPCKPTDAIYPIWETVCSQILAKIDLTGILSVGCHRIGNAQVPDSCMPNVLVAVSPECDRDWNQVREDILAVLVGYQLHAVGVIIRKDVPVLGSSVLSSKTLKADKCTSKAGVGYSLGPHGSENDQGTLGGFIELRNPSSGQWVEFGLTCFHCVTPSDQDMVNYSLNDQQIFSDWKSNGVRTGDQNASRLLSIDSPSQRDVRAGIENLSQLIVEIKREPYYTKVDRAMQDDEFVIGSEKSVWKAYSNQIRALDDNKHLMAEYLNTNKHRIESVFAASGLREEIAASVAPNPKLLPTVRDWALVRLANGRAFGSNSFINCSDLDGVERMDFRPRGQTIQPETTLHKMGRRTGATQGIYNGLKTAKIARKYVGGQWVKIPTLEHSVVSNDRKDVFEMGGDSGAFVYTATGHVVGMCFGGPLHGDEGYFSHIDDILEDIRKITGVKEIRLKQ